MTLSAILFLVLSIVLLGGGLIGSIVMLRRHPEVDEYPPGGGDDLPEGLPPIRDT